MRPLIAFLMIFFFCAGIGPSIYTEEIANANTQLDVPPYAKWGKMAMQKTKEKYPNADIIDYLHVGRKKGEQTSVETFQLLLKEEKEFGVKVDIEFENETERVIKISFKEIPAST